ncbi:hypothetical protein BSKO_00798 [Bryopsis sp. KO-2023]|nr:hypothetical protein BSKO_00798 [Bryopsis sp. KO-2023]
MFPWSTSASNAALEGGKGSRALPLTSDQEKDILTLNSSFGDPKEDGYSTSFLQGGGESDMGDVEDFEREKLAEQPPDVNSKFSILLHNDTFDKESETTSSELRTPLRPFNRETDAMDAPQPEVADTPRLDSQSVVKQLVNSLDWDELEELLASVWVPPRIGTNGDASTRRGDVVVLQRQHVALSCKTLVDKLKLVVSFPNDKSTPKDAAADVIAWILQEGVSLNFGASELANDLMVFAQSSCMPVSRAGLRTLRNLVVRSVMEYREVVLKHPRFANLFERIDAEGYIYVCEIVSHIAKSAQSEAACNEFFQEVCKVAINPIMGTLSLYETGPRDNGVLRWTVIALITLRCGHLVEQFASDLGKFDIVWKIIDREESLGAHDLAMELLAGLVSSGDERILARSLEHIGRIFKVLLVGSLDDKAFHFQLNALKIAQNIQMRQKESFGACIDLEHLAKLRLVLEGGGCELQKLCLTMLSDLLAVDCPLLFDSGLNIIRPVIVLLGSEAEVVQHSCIEVLRSMIRKDSQAVMEQATGANMLDHLVALLQTSTFVDCKQLYEIVTWFVESTTNELGLEQEIVHALVANFAADAVERRVILPSIIAVLCENQRTCEEAVKAGLVGYLVHALSDADCIELKSIAILLDCLLRNSDTAVPEIHDNHPGLVQALLQHIDTVGPVEDCSDGVPLVSVLVSSLVAVLVTSGKRADFATPKSLQLLIKLLTSGNADQEKGAVQVVKASIEWFSLSDVKKSNVLLPLCSLLPKYLEQENGVQEAAHSIMFVVGYMGQSEAAMIADSIMKLRDTVADKVWEAVLGMTGGDAAIHNGVMKVLKELRQQENKFFRDNSNNLSVVHLEHQNQALNHKNQELSVTNCGLIEQVQDLGAANSHLSQENDELHVSVARLSAQAQLTAPVQNTELLNELQTENSALREELQRKDRCIETLETEKAKMEEGARVMKEGMEEQHRWIQTLQAVVDCGGALNPKNG